MVKGLEALKNVKLVLKTLRHNHCEEWVDFITIEKDLEVLSVIYNSPFIIDSLAELGKLPPEAKKRYLFGTITNAEVEKVEEFFKNGEK